MPGVADKVVIVTGAGGGLGRSYARFLAANGALVVVNDLGGARDGSGAGTSMADTVVDEIRSAGGRAVANYSSVATAEGAADIIVTALEEFGAVHGIVSNAGILRDGAFHKMSDDNWDSVLRVHLDGGYHVIRAAWPLLREQQFGRIVVATSTSGSSQNRPREPLRRNSCVISASMAYSFTPGFTKPHTRSKALPVIAIARWICATSSAVLRERMRCMIGALRYLALGEGRNVRAAINQEMVGPESALADRDEIAFFPPVTGG